MPQLNKLEELVKELQPQIETQLGVELGDIKIGFPKDLAHDLIISGRCESKEEAKRIANDCYVDAYGLAIAELNKIYYFSELQDDLTKDLVLHELAHFLFYKITKQNYNNKIESHIIKEGFAEYMSIEYFYNLYTETEKMMIDSRGQYLVATCLPDIRNRSYYNALGYVFFRTITDVLGKEFAFEAIKDENITLKEILIPSLYLNRIKKI